ncbi:hypothetical protein MMPV_000726 [Pyropia vietnamensis]
MGRLLPPATPVGSWRMASGAAGAPASPREAAVPADEAAVPADEAVAPAIPEEQVVPVAAAAAAAAASGLHTPTAGRAATPIPPPTITPYVGLDVSSMSQQERQDLRLRSKAIPLVVDTDPVTVLYEDARLVAVAKPAYVKVHPAHRFIGGTLVNRLIGYLGGAEPYVLHRLDMHTTGVVLFGKAKGVVAPLAAAFQNRTIHKEYLALVDGDAAAVAAGLTDLRDASAIAAAAAVATPKAAAAVDAPRFSVDVPICRDPDVSIARRVNPSDPSDGKPALTHFMVLAVNAPRTVSLIHCTPVSGRTHQLRIHLQSVGLPIVGDDLYGRERALYSSIDELRAASAVPERAQVIDGVAVRAGLKLHAWRLHVPGSVLSGGGQGRGTTTAAADSAVIADRVAATDSAAAEGADPTAAGVVITAPPPPEMLACAAYYGVAMPQEEAGEGGEGRT